MLEPDLGRFDPWFPRSERRVEPSDVLLDELERSLGVKLPSDYRALVLRYGGASLHGAAFTIPEGTPCGGGRTIEVLYGFGRDDYGYDLRAQRRAYADRVGSNLLPI